jgi:hypothetical protein
MQAQAMRAQPLDGRRRLNSVNADNSSAPVALADWSRDMPCSVRPAAAQTRFLHK